MEVRGWSAGQLVRAIAARTRQHVDHADVRQVERGVPANQCVIDELNALLAEAGV